MMSPFVSFSGSIRLAALALLCCAAGCGNEIDTQYGSRQRPGSPQSVNGVTALADMFARQGHRVRSWSWLSPQLNEQADVIVWFPDRMVPPEQETRRWLEDWLLEKPDRTLIYVGRDFDGGLAYWEAIKPTAPPDQATVIGERVVDAMHEATMQRTLVTPDVDHDWFEMHPSGRRLEVSSLEGSPEWIEGIDAADVEIQLRSRFLSPSWVETLLSSEDHAIATRDQWGDSQLIVVTNGSFLLNYGLVNHEHRKLASRLIDSVGEGKTVYFLESGQWGDPEIREDDPDLEMPSGLAVLTVFPFNYLLLQLALVGIVFCWSRAAIFGRARTPVDESVSDFGQHVEALGDLLARTGDHEYARQRLEQYHQGKWHDEPASRKTLVAEREEAAEPSRDESPPDNENAEPPGTRDTHE